MKSNFPTKCLTLNSNNNDDDDDGDDDENLSTCTAEYI